MRSAHRGRPLSARDHCFVSRPDRRAINFWRWMGLIGVIIQRLASISLRVQRRAIFVTSSRSRNGSCFFLSSMADNDDPVRATTSETISRRACSLTLCRLHPRHASTGQFDVFGRRTRCVIIEYGNDQPSGFPGQGIQVGSMRQPSGPCGLGVWPWTTCRSPCPMSASSGYRCQSRILVRLLVQRLVRIDACMDENPVFIDVYGWQVFHPAQMI